MVASDGKFTAPEEWLPGGFKVRERGELTGVRHDKVGFDAVGLFDPGERQDRLGHRPQSPRRQQADDDEADRDDNGHGTTTDQELGVVPVKVVDNRLTEESPCARFGMCNQPDREEALYGSS